MRYEFNNTSSQKEVMMKITTRYYSIVSFTPGVNVDAPINESGAGLQEVFIDGDDFLSLWRSLDRFDRKKIKSITLIKDRSDRKMKVIAKWFKLFGNSFALKSEYPHRENNKTMRRIILARHHQQIEYMNLVMNWAVYASDGKPWPSKRYEEKKLTILKKLGLPQFPRSLR
tara:strand:+ start:988 stop:1500 length:513 start_codon:yes stop_codon:yes gene_type:complete